MTDEETRRDCQSKQRTARRGVETAELKRAGETARCRRRNTQSEEEGTDSGVTRGSRELTKEKRDCQMRRPEEEERRRDYQREKESSQREKEYCQRRKRVARAGQRNQGRSRDCQCN